MMIRAEVSRTSPDPAQPWSVDLFDWDEPVERYKRIEDRAIGVRRKPFATFAEAIAYACDIVGEGGWDWA